MAGPEQWPAYERVIRTASGRGLRFALGGAASLAVYTGRVRNTKDLDIYVLPPDRERMIDLLGDCGLRDCHDHLPYDRSWIYRASDGNTIVDAIWAMANHRAQVDEAWISGGPSIDFGGHRVQVLPPEEAIWAKIYVLQRDRTDWPDLLNILECSGRLLDWRRLLARLGEDRALLKALLTVFAWLHPGRAAEFPDFLWRRFGMRPPAADSGAGPVIEYIRALDTRPWFAASREGNGQPAEMKT